MPLYVYKCDTCEKEYERFLGLHAPSELSCEVCGKKSYRVIARPRRSVTLQKKKKK